MTGALAELGVGAVLGLAAGLSPGPLMGLVVAQTVRHGVREGLKVAAAPLLTDVPIVLLAVLVIGAIAARAVVLGLVALAGAGVLLAIALESIRSRPIDTEALAGAAPAARSWTRGAVVNALNPHPYLFWITIGGPRLVADLAAGALIGAAFLAGFYACLVGSKVVLALVAGRARRHLLGGGYVWGMRALGAALVLLAGSLALEGLRLLGIVPA